MGGDAAPSSGMRADDRSLALPLGSLHSNMVAAARDLDQAVGDTLESGHTSCPG